MASLVFTTMVTTFNGILSIGTLPLVITSDVSPAGNHSLRIVASNDKESTISYIISDTADSTGKWDAHVAVLYLHRCTELQTYVSLLHYKLRFIYLVEYFIHLLSCCSCSSVGSASDQRLTSHNW